MTDKPRKKTVSITLPIEVYDRLKQCAEEDTRTLAGELRQILTGYTEYLDRGGASWGSSRSLRGVEQYNKK